MKKIDPEEARKRMYYELIKAIYPVLIPIEEACCKTQMENIKIIEKCAAAALDKFFEEKY